MLDHKKGTVSILKWSLFLCFKIKILVHSANRMKLVATLNPHARSLATKILIWSPPGAVYTLFEWSNLNIGSESAVPLSSKRL